MNASGIWDEQVLAGEVKTSAAEFDDVQLQRDIDLLRRLGADIHLLAAVTDVPQETRAAAKVLCDAAGLELHVYDSSQLRPAAPAKPAAAIAATG